MTEPAETAGSEGNSAEDGQALLPCAGRISLRIGPLSVSWGFSSPVTTSCRIIRAGNRNLLQGRKHCFAGRGA